MYSYGSPVKLQITETKIRMCLDRRLIEEKGEKMKIELLIHAQFLEVIK